jgi:hypothetical protein
MRRGHLSDYFVGAAVKRLASVDADPGSSHQHEITGSKPLLRILGDRPRTDGGQGEDARFLATYIWLNGEQDAITEDGRLSWYDSRRNQPRRSPEWRLYYQSNVVTRLMRPGDFLFVAVRGADHLLFVVAPAGSTIVQQLLWLFDLPAQPGSEFVPQEIATSGSAEIDFAVRYILDELQIEIEEPDSDPLDRFVERFGVVFPTTREFSALARASLSEVPVLEAPDEALLSWVEREEDLFRRLERRVVAARLHQGFVKQGEADVDGFIAFSLSVQNRRKSRAGSGLEHHVEALLLANEIEFQRGVETENGNKPDFLFPSQKAYLDQEFPAANLTMLGSKSSVKERWRQVLSEAERIQSKHLLTLEPSVSTNQTREMKAKQLQLVVPAGLHATYTETQRGWLMSVADFISLVRERQRHML